MKNIDDLIALKNVSQDVFATAYNQFFLGVSPDLCGFTTLRAGTFPNIALGTICL